MSERTRPWLPVLAAGVVLAVGAHGAAVTHGARAQPRPTVTAGPSLTPGTTVTPAPSATGSPSATLPPPYIAGTWSITRSWWRSCPGCASSVVRTTRWVIEQRGATVTVDRGPSGTIQAYGSGGLLALQGLESSGEGVLRFHYSTLKVSQDSSSFEGSFGGSERIQNPCGANPPIVTCFASAGYLQATRISQPTPPGTSTASPAPPTTSPGPPTTAPPTATAWPSATATRTPVSTSTSLPSVTPSPPIMVSRYLPMCRR